MRVRFRVYYTIRYLDLDPYRANAIKKQVYPGHPVSEISNFSQNNVP